MGILSCSSRTSDCLSWIASPMDDVSSAIEFMWLGQAGFIFRSTAMMIGIDLYLSDSLAEKYRGTHFDHQRMMLIPCDPIEMRRLDLLLSTHGHTDHMDGGTLSPLYAEPAGTTPLFVCPRAEIIKAHNRGVPFQKMMGVDVFEKIYIPTEGDVGCTITVIPAAHEVITKDEFGNHLHLGYLVELSGLRLFHSGDSIPYARLPNVLQSLQVDVAFLPVNGRDVFRKAHGIPGNFTIAEALSLVRATEIPLFVPHHFGLFDFNTVSVEEIVRQTRETPPKTIIPELGTIYRITKEEA